jgi:C-terminal processing protease CtpA/Prc
MESNPAVIDTLTQTEIIQSLSEKLTAYYIFPEVAEQICDRLQEHLEVGDYTDITEGRFFAYALTVHMQEVSQDEHLWVRWHREPLPDVQAELRQNREWMDEQRKAAELENYGLRMAEKLPGNVGYLDIRRFHKAEWGGDTAIAAMNFLANTNALIIDLRKCEGGYPSMVLLISSYLFGEDPVHLNSIYWRDEDFTQQYWTLPQIPGQRYDDKPVYVLTSQDTFSGGEEFAYNLKIHQRATLVGETTAGGAHPGASYRLHPYFEAFIPVGRAINPLTNENWQGVGVVPDIAVSQGAALEVAYSLALESIIASLGDTTSGPARKLLKEAQAALEELELT